MKWLNAKAQPKKRWLLPKYYNLPDPMKQRAPFYHEYDYSYGSPYAGTSEDTYGKGEGQGTIRMDPEKGSGLGLG